MQKRKIDKEKVARLRNDLWLSQTELAEKSGVAVHTISRMETGVHEYPRRSTIFAVAEALGVRPESLLRREDESGSGHPLPPPQEPPGEDSQGGSSRRTG